MTSRITWDELWLEMATLVGRRSLCSRAQYGAVIVSADNRVLSVGYNGAPPGREETAPCVQWCERAKAAAVGDPVDPDYMDCHAVHAEINALMRAGNLWLEKSPTLYVNGVTCLRCALTVSSSGIRTIVMHKTAYEEKRNPEATKALCEKYGVEVRFV